MTKQKSFVKEIDFTKEELLELIDLGLAFKELKKKRILHKYLEGLNIALIFEKASREGVRLSRWQGKIWA